MESFCKWFNSQSLLIKVILLLIPVVGWVVELLVRLSKFLDKKDALSLVVLLLFIFVGWGWFLEVVDVIYLCLTGHLILAD